MRPTIWGILLIRPSVNWGEATAAESEDEWSSCWPIGSNGSRAARVEREDVVPPVPPENAFIMVSRESGDEFPKPPSCNTSFRLKPADLAVVVVRLVVVVVVVVTPNPLRSTPNIFARSRRFTWLLAVNGENVVDLAKPRSVPVKRLKNGEDGLRNAFGSFSRKARFLAIS